MGLAGWHRLALCKVPYALALLNGAGKNKVTRQSIVTVPAPRRARVICVILLVVWTCGGARVGPITRDVLGGSPELSQQSHRMGVDVAVSNILAL